MLPLRLDGVAQAGGEVRVGPAVVAGDDVDPAVLHHGDVVEAGDGGGDAAISRLVEDLARHQLHGPVDAHHTDAVVAHRSDDPGDVRSVQIRVHRIGIAVDGIDAVAIVDETIAVVVDTVGVAVRLVAEHVGGEILVVVVDPGIDDGHDDVAATRGDVPGFGGVNVGVVEERDRRVEPPELAIDEARVVGRGLERQAMIRLDVQHVRVVAVLLECLGDGHLRGELDQLQVLDGGELLDGRRPGGRVERVAPDPVAAGAEPHQDLIRGVPRRGAEPWRRTE